MSTETKFKVQKYLTLIIILPITLMLFGIFTKLVNYVNSWILFGYVITSLFGSFLAYLGFKEAIAYIGRLAVKKGAVQSKIIMVESVFRVILTIVFDFSSFYLFGKLYVDKISITLSGIIIITSITFVVHLIFFVVKLSAIFKLLKSNPSMGEADEEAMELEIRKMLENMKDDKKLSDLMEQLKDEDEVNKKFSKLKHDKRLNDMLQKIEKSEDLKQAFKDMEDSIKNKKIEQNNTKLLGEAELLDDHINSEPMNNDSKDNLVESSDISIDKEEGE